MRNITKKNLKVLIIILILLSTASITLVLTEISAEDSSDNLYPTNNLSSDERLYITNDGDLAGNSSSGTGELESPYIIENYDIETTEHYGIYITGTTKYFTIRNCTIEAFGDGICIDTVASNTVTIYNNTCSGAGHGIVISFTTYVNITENICNDNSDGIFLEYSPYAIVTNNTCAYQANGVYVEGSAHSIFRMNKFYSNTQHGIWTKSANTTLIENMCWGNTQYGIYIDAADNCEIIENECYSNGYYGIYLISTSSTTVNFNYVHDNSRRGIYIRWGADNNIINNTLYWNRWEGINNELAARTTIVNNTLTKDGFDISAPGDLAVYNELNVANNTVNDKPLGFFRDLNDATISGDLYGQIIMAYCSNISISNVHIMDTSRALIFRYCNSINISNNDFNANNYGSIYFTSSSSIFIQNNTCSNNKNYGGIYAIDCNDVIINDNFASYNQFGIYFHIAIDFKVINNTLFGNSWYNSRFQVTDYGIITNNSIAFGSGGSSATGTLFYGCTNTNVTYNIFHANYAYALYVDSDSANNIIHHNTFTENGGTSSQAYDEGTNNIWYDTITLEGNYWDDWSEVGNYTIDGVARSNDTYPLGEPLIIIISEYHRELTYILLAVPVVYVGLRIKRKKKK